MDPIVNTKNGEIKTQLGSKIQLVFFSFPHIPLPEAERRGHPSAVGLLPVQHGLSGDVKAAGRRPAPGRP